MRMKMVCFYNINPLTAGAAYFRVFIFISTLSTTYKYVKEQMWHQMWHQIWKEFTSIFSNLNNFLSLEVVEHVSETQLQVGENLNWIIRRLKC